MLEGYKTYAAAAAGIVVVVAGWLGIIVDPELEGALLVVFGFLTAIFMRFGQKKEAAKVEEATSFPLGR